MKVGILGSGLMGGKLGVLFAQSGHEVVFSYARDEKKLERLARDAGKNARAGTPGETAKASDAVLLSVNWWNLDDLLDQAGDLAGKVIVSCSLPMNEENTALALGHSTSGAEELSRRLPKARLVSAFNTVPSEVFFGVFESRHKSPRPSLVICGDDAGAKEVASQLARDVGFDPIDTGALRMARYTEPFALLMGQLAYEGSSGPEVAYRFDWYRQKH